MGRRRKPPTRCPLCKDPIHHDIEADLANGARMRPIARKYGVSYDCLWRHWHRHVHPEEKIRLRFGGEPIEKVREMIAESSSGVLGDLDYARKFIFETLMAVPIQDAHARSALTGRLHENARIRGMITGELANSPLIQNTTTINILQLPEFTTFQADLVRALSRFPEACNAVLAEFQRLENSVASLPAVPALEHQPNDHAIAVV